MTSGIAATALLAASLLVAACGAARHDPAGSTDVIDTASPIGPRELSADEQVHQVLDRLAFGARPGDIDRVRAIGVDAWIAQQLRPDRIAEDAADRTADSLTAGYVSPADVVRDLADAGRGDSTARRMLRQKYAEVGRAVQGARVARAVGSERQLQEELVDLWANHFSVFGGKGPIRLYLAQYEDEAIRPHVLGKFRDLLGAVAHSPAMLFYLDNWMSVGPNSSQAEGRPNVRYGPYGRPHVVRPKQRRNSGLNENYGRELLELHTLSVNGGYSQRDVTEVAKVFTGWTIERSGGGASFRFDPSMHEPGPKFILGHKVKAKGEDEGKEVLHMLATSPQTAHFISLKLAQRFVSDDPPPALVDRMAKTFEKKKGDIREVLLTLFHSPEFWSDETYRAKVKTPLEFVASAVRATGADVEDATFLARQLNRMGMPLYGAQPPTGYSMKADAWVSSSELLTRMNFALALTAGKIRGVNLDAAQLADGQSAIQDANTELSTMETKLLASDVSKQTHDSILQQLADPKKNDQGKANAMQAKPSEASTMAGLLLGSPEFQRR